MLHGPSLADIFGHGKSRALPFPQLHAGRKDLDFDDDDGGLLMVINGY